MIWSVADILRGGWKQHEYQDVILPLVVLKRLDSILADTKAKVLDSYNQYHGKLKDLDQILKHASGVAFYNTSPYDFKNLFTIFWYTEDIILKPKELCTQATLPKSNLNTSDRFSNQPGREPNQRHLIPMTYSTLCSTFWSRVANGEHFPRIIQNGRVSIGTSLSGRNEKTARQRVCLSKS